MPMKYASKAFRRREKEIQRRNSKNLNQVDSDEDDNGNKLNDYEQKRLQNIVDRKNKIVELKVNFIFMSFITTQQNPSKHICEFAQLYGKHPISM